MPTLVPSRRPPAKAAKPRAWRVTRSTEWDWKRIAIVGGGALVAIALGAGVLFASGAGAPAAPATKPTASAIVAREIVSSSQIGNTPVATPTPLAVTPPPPVAATQLSPSPGPAFSAGPPAQVQQVTPARQPPNAPTSGPAPAASPASSLPGSLVSGGNSAPRATPTAAGPADSSISDDLYAINARATSLARAASALSGSSQTPVASGTPRPAPTDTPIPTAAPPIPPKA